jgi:EAL domain-containing protein (putative c-di-GMP-specific phosphodiesterase class I)
LVASVLRQSGLPSRRLILEITETALLGMTPTAQSELDTLVHLGVRLAIDDFGMGYSSLSYLHRFPIDILKIDRSFVGRLTEQDDGPELARAVVMLGETLGLETVAEGVEHEEQVAKLLELGCVAAQGFLFARSAPLQDVSSMSFAKRRAELRGHQAHADRLTATGRFNVGNAKTRSVA